MPVNSNSSWLFRKLRIIHTMFFMVWIITSTAFANIPTDLKFDKILSSDILVNAIIYKVYQDKVGFLWFGTNQGLVRYDGHRTKVYLHDPKDPSSLIGDNVNFIIEDAHGTLWISTSNDGLCSLGPEREKFTRFHPDPHDTNELDRFSGYLYIDRSGTLWQGTLGAGLKRYDRETEKFFCYLPDKNNPDSLSHAFVTGKRNYIDILPEKFEKIKI